MKKLFVIAGSILLFSCKTYYLSTNEFLKQFDSSGVRNQGFISPAAVKGNTLTHLKCYDKKGNIHVIPVTPHTAVRITTAPKKRTQFYLNTIIVKDSVLTASKSHFFNAPIVAIPFNTITKIEIQK